MRKILIFFLILVSFSCATLDNQVKENPSVEKDGISDESKNTANVVASDPNTKINNSEELENPKEKLSSTKENLNPQISQKEGDEKIVINSSDSSNESNTIKTNGEKKKEETDAKKEEKYNSEEPQKNNKKMPSTVTDVQVIQKNVKNTIADELALQDSSDLFANSIRIETKKEEKKIEQKKILPSIEILKELEETLDFFKKAIPNSVATKQRVEKKEKNSKTEIAELEKTEDIKEEEQTREIATKDEDLGENNSSTKDNSSTYDFDEENPTVTSNEDDLTHSFNDEEQAFNFDEDSSQFNFNEEVEPFNFDDDSQHFNFDDENKNEADSKQNEDHKGQLSSIVDEEDKVNISRYTNIIKGQNIDFSYPGEGWVYLGEETSQKGLNYVKRKMEDGKTFFTFIAENEGNYILNFSYFDVFSGDFIVDAVSVKVMPNNDGVQKDSLVLEYQGKNGKKLAETLPKKTPNEVHVDADKVGINTEDTREKDDVSTKKSVSNTNSESNIEMGRLANSGNNTENSTYKEPEVFTNIASINPENAKNKVSTEDARKIINEVSEAISNGNAKVALKRLDDFFAVASTNMDEAYFLRGKAYEWNTEQKNIKMALSAYKFLTKTFPNSAFWNEADARIRYIEKFFVKIK